MTIRDAVRDGAALLRGTGSASPWLDASLLLGRSLGMDGTRLLASYPDELGADISQNYDALLARRAAGESVAYIVGKKEFRGLDFEVGPGVLVPRPETEILVELAVAAVSEDARRPSAAPYAVHDACTGSGCIGVSLAIELPAVLGRRSLEVELSDISPVAIETASRNALRLLGKGLPIRAWDFLDGAAGGAYALITANPPYLTADDMAARSPELAFEPELALAGGDDGMDPLRALAPRAARALVPGGSFMTEIGSWQGEAARAIMEAAGFEGVVVSKDLAGLDRIVAGRTRGGGAAWKT